jgi:copper chaperone CopZ
MKTITELRVEGMSCMNCVHHVTKALEGVPGVQSAQVSLDDKRASVSHDGSVQTDALVAAVEEEGYQASSGE